MKFWILLFCSHRRKPGKVSFFSRSILSHTLFRPVELLLHLPHRYCVLPLLFHYFAGYLLFAFTFSPSHSFTYSVYLWVFIDFFHSLSLSIARSLFYYAMHSTFYKIITSSSSLSLSLFLYLPLSFFSCSSFLHCLCPPRCLSENAFT